MIIPDSSNYFMAQRLAKESKCKGLPNKPCTKLIEASRFLKNLNANLNAPEICSYCSFAKKNPLPPTV